jgi:hypothetical protein
MTVDIERPRDLQVESTRMFVDMRIKIWNIIRSEVEQSMMGDRHDA